MSGDRFEISRRGFIQAAGVTGIAGFGLLAAPSASAGTGRTVAVFGGGIAGLTVAHELAERGFDVTVHERRAWGGKARSTQVAGAVTGGRKPLPGEHGWRVFFGFYQHTIDTMRRVPFATNEHGVFDNLVATPQVRYARAGAADLVLPMGQLDPRPYTPREIIELMQAIAVQQDLPAPDVARFLARMTVYMSSCKARRTGELENIDWYEFTEADKYSEEFRRIVINSLSHAVQASKAPDTSASFSGHVLEMILYSLLGRGANGPAMRILDGPTTDTFFTPWLAALKNLGVKLNLGSELNGWRVDRGRIVGANVIASDTSRQVVTADFYVCALPVERARALWNSKILDADPSLAGMNHLSTAWMNGLKFFLREQRTIVKGHTLCVDSPWLISCISQSQFWPGDFAATYGDGTVRESLSVIISDWDKPGILFGKAARDCTPDEIAAEAWAQLKAHLDDTGEQPLTDDLIVSWDIDAGMVPTSGGKLVSEDELVLPVINERQFRPDVTTRIPNLFLAGDYLVSDWEVANMETASYNARRAANAVLDRAGSTRRRAMTVAPYEPEEWKPLQDLDAARYAAGQPNLFDRELTLDEVKDMLTQLA